MTHESTVHSDELLKSSLTELEHCMETPILPGSHSQWSAQCRQLWIDVESALQTRIDDGHGELLKEIASQDPELLPKVEQLLGEDTALLKRVGQLRNDADWLAAGCHQESANPEKIEEHLRQFNQDSLECIQRIRAQETAIVTWYQEAFNRDRGIAD